MRVRNPAAISAATRSSPKRTGRNPPACDRRRRLRARAAPRAARSPPRQRGNLRSGCARSAPRPARRALPCSSNSRLASECCGIVEHQGHVVAGAYGERLMILDVDQEIRRCRARPCCRRAVRASRRRRRRFGARGVPIRHRGEVGEARMIVADAVDDREMPILVEPLETGHGRLQSEVVVELAQLGRADAKLRPRAVVGVVGVRHDGVQPVICARQLDHDQNACHRPSAAGVVAPSQRRGAPADRAEPQSVHPGAQHVPPRRDRSISPMTLSSAASLRSGELILGRAHDQMRDQPQRLLEIAPGARQVAGAKLLVEEARSPSRAPRHRSAPRGSGAAAGRPLPPSSSPAPRRPCRSG